MEINGDVLTWLLAGDPAIRWQVLRDLLHAGRDEVERERAQVVLEGWGARLLACQDDNGLWAGQLYDHKWISTTYTMLLLRQLGLPPDHPQTRLGCIRLLDGGYQSEGALSYAKSSRHIDLGVNGMVLSILSYFRHSDERVARIVEYLLAKQSADGHWEPYLENMTLKYRFDTTLQVLEGLAEYLNQSADDSPLVEAAISRGVAFLLAHRIYLDSRGNPLEPRWTLFSFPPRWHYDVLAAMDFLYRWEYGYEPGMQSALDLIKAKARPDGRWALQNRHSGRTFFEMEKVGSPSRWNTLRALRVFSIEKE